MAAQEPKTIAFVLYPGITLLDMVGPLQVFSVLRGFNDQYQPVVVAERIEPMPTDTPLAVTADKTFAEVPDPTVVIVPGGGPPTIKAMGNEVIHDYLRRVADTAQVVGSVCTGAMILAAAGLLEGRARGHHPLVPPPPAGAPGRNVSPGAVGGGRQDHHLGRGIGRDRHGPGPGRPADRRADRPYGAALDRVRPHPPFGGINWDQIDRDMAEPQVAQWVRTQLADRPELLARLSA
jgi:putative intracellular protease/amidase